MLLYPEKPSQVLSVVGLKKNVRKPRAKVSACRLGCADEAAAHQRGDLWSCHRSSVRRASGLDHMAFAVVSREDWLLALDHVRACGVEIVSGPYVHAPDGGEKGFTGGSGSHAFYFLDPDGNRIEDYCWMMTVTRPSSAAPHADA